jgi:RNA polymerase sigma-70 factor (family 1)
MGPQLNDSDADLVKAISVGDKTAFERLYRTYAAQLYSYVRKNIPCKEDCEEVIQETFESVWIRRAELEITSSIRAYLFGILRFKIIRYFRKSSLKKKYSDHFLLFEAVYDQAEDPESNFAAIQSALDKVIKELPERCQEALRLRLSEDLSNPDIAKRMNISTRTVEAYMFRAFNHIRSSYKQYTDSALILAALIMSGRF